MIEKIFKREDGSQVKVTVSLITNNSLVHSHRCGYEFDVQIKGFRKREWKYTWGGDDWDYRKLGHNDRVKFILEKKMQHVTKTELHNLYLELWESLKPKLIEDEES